jgi:uncharacterized damage-inducible protein DinB
MTQEIYLKGYGSNTKRISAFCEGISETESIFRPYDKVNHLKWEMGHLTNTRNTLISLLATDGKLAEFPNEATLFGYGSKPEADNYPSLEAIVSAYKQRGEKLIELLGATSPEVFITESPIKIPSLGNTIGEQLYFFMLHEVHHRGEINYLTNLIKRLREV